MKQSGQWAEIDKKDHHDHLSSVQRTAAIFQDLNFVEVDLLFKPAYGKFNRRLFCLVSQECSHFFCKETPSGYRWVRLANVITGEAPLEHGRSVQASSQSSSDDDASNMRRNTERQRSDLTIQSTPAWPQRCGSVPRVSHWSVHEWTGAVCPKSQSLTH